MTTPSPDNNPGQLLSDRQARKPGALLEELVRRAKALPPVRMGVVHPCDAPSLQGALAAGENRLIVPTLIGPRRKIESVAEAAGLGLEGVEIVDAPYSHAAAAAAVEMVRRGRLQSVMKGSLHTDEVMHAVVQEGAGLRTERRVSHVFVIDTPGYHKLLLVTDAAINIAPTLDNKRDIVRNLSLIHI